MKAANFSLLFHIIERLPFFISTKFRVYSRGMPNRPPDENRMVKSMITQKFHAAKNFVKAS